MQRFAVFAAAVVLACCALLAFGGNNGPPEDSARVFNASTTDQVDAPLIVHEWGTFTSFSGSDGVKLEFRPLLDSDLPSFVHNRAGLSIPLFAKPSIRAIQRMETPVTYFYTPVERDVSVRVEFPEGLLTEYYPPVRQYAPVRNANEWAIAQKKWRTAPAALLKNSMLDWGQVHLIPAQSLRAKVRDEELSNRIGRQVEEMIVPPAAGFDHYAAARATDSAIVQVRHHFPETVAGWDILPGDYFEKFLFYRGVGNFTLPLTLSEEDAGTFVLTNAGADQIRSLFLVDVNSGALRFNRFDRISADSRMTLTQSNVPSDVDALADAMTASLQAEGLYEKEARAMVACWRSSWFGEDGTRLLYIVPARMTDELLPLHIDPPPDEQVRVLVGRMEIMPAATEQQVLELLDRSETAREARTQDDQTSFRSPALEPLLAMGRLAEPALARVRHIATDARLQEEATRLIQDLRDERNPEVESAPSN